ncbi:hypothetical protein HOP62_08690 [Halomonas sp. MCCC 1A17488]|uniref:cellulose binding domain-containing protein n=1 Tax=unclassified Halomonas TaxID=2609666 RepID=UPI0018D273E9|nr:MULTISPECIES: cellulose binding domain-containing protein [unclassified Halomonas]MCE8016152.1 hypothetical protein [Halomonas sp. MCCC 1A17488]MCG3239485.1 hypothetical protein [Halomonas sp. MCCC 1A17488]QPP50592.1 cellulose binding domain-containing protein [Halomonas sp. SS10-MC5]
MSARVGYTVTSQWNSGFVFEVTVTNEGTLPIDDYRVGFDLPGSITDLWGGRISVHEGQRYEIMDDDADNDIAPGQAVSFKVKSVDGSSQMPTRFSVNDQPMIVESPEVDEPDSVDEAFIDGVATVEPGVSAAELETLLNGAPKGASVRLAEGEYVYDDSVSVTRSDVSLIGAGSGKTTITFSDTALERDDAHGLLFEGKGTASAGRLQADAAEGNDTLTLESGHGLATGDMVRIWQDNDAEYFEEIGNTSWQGSQYAPLRTSMARVLERDGSTVTLDRGVHFDFDGGEARIQRVDALENVALEGVSINYPLGTPDAGAFNNTLPSLLDYHAVEFNGTVDARVADVEVANGPSVAFVANRSVDLQAENLHAEGAFNKGSGGNGYAYELFESYDGTFTDLSDSGMRHSALFASWRSSVGNDIHVEYTDRDINFHGGQDHDNTVRVSQSVRDPASDNMSPTLWINQGGESFGAPTDPTANQVMFDYVVGSRRNDVVPGSDDGVYLDGARGHDTLLGGAGDDILRGGPGNDRLEGGPGNDTALMMGDYAAYDLQPTPDGGLFLDGWGDDDLLVDVERAVFADGTVLDIESRTVTSGAAPEIPTADEILADDIIRFPDDEAPPETPGEPPADDIAAAVHFESVSRWASGYVMAVEITNETDSNIEDPRIDFELPAEITQFYGANLLAHEGDTYSLALSGDDTLTPGETQRFSFKAYAPESHLPQRLRLDGQELEVDLDQLVAGRESESELGTETSITSNLTSTWSSGYTAEVIVENSSNLAIDSPSISFDLPGEIDTLWNGTATRDGNRYTVSDDNPTTLQPGESWRFSYKAYDTSQALPANAVVEGTPQVPANEPTAVTSNIISEWSGGYTTEVLVENTSTDAIADPVVDFALPTDVDTLWNGVLERDGERYRVSNDDATVLQPGEVWRFSYRVYDEQQHLPDDVVVEGQAEPAKLDPSEIEQVVDSDGNPVTGQTGSTLTGTDGDDTLNGLRGDDYLTGGAGNDRLVGGSGADTLTGGAGADVFTYLSTWDSTPQRQDTLLDFNRLEGDRIDLSAIDANSELEGPQAFTWRGEEGFSGDGGELRNSGNTLQADVNGDGVVDLQLAVLGVNALEQGDLILQS